MKTIISVLLFGVIGFFIGYILFGKVLGEYISLKYLYTEPKDIFSIITDEMILKSIREKILLSTGMGGIVGLILGLVSPSKPKRNETSINSDELAKLFELKQRGAISEDEYNEQKSKLFN